MAKRNGIHQEYRVDTTTLDEKVIAYKQMTQDSGIGIVDMIYGIEDKVVFRYYYGNNQASKKHTCTIRYTKKNEYAYFITENNRQHMSDFLWTDIGGKMKCLDH